MNVFSMAWRNLWRNTRRTAVTVGAMAFGLWVMVLYSGLVDGYLLGMARDVLDYEVGEIQVFAEGYRDEPSLYTRIEGHDALAADLEARGFEVAPRLQAGGLAAAGEASAGVQFIGIDVEADPDVVKIADQVAAGSWLDPADPEGVVVGRRLARTLGVRPGVELIVLSQATDGSMANGLYTVRGVLGTVGDATDRAGLFFTEEAFRRLMVVPEGAHQLLLRVPEGMPLDQAADEVETLDPSIDVWTWRELMPIVAQMLDSTKSLVFIVFFIVYIAIGILILNAMLMAVFERIREFGVMKAIGTGPGLVFRLLLLETVIQTALALAIGLGLALPAGWYLQEVGLNVGGLAGTSVLGLAMPPMWYAHFGPATLVGPIVALVVIVGGAALYPALKAARIKPIDAIHYH